MIILSSDIQLSALDHRAAPFRGSPSPGEQDGQDRSRSDSFTRGTTGFASADMLEQAVTPSQLPELGDALKNLYAGRIKRHKQFSLGHQTHVEFNNSRACLALYFESINRTPK